MRFDEIKTETINFRAALSFERALKAVAEAKNLGMMTMLEVIFFACERHVSDVKDGGLATKTNRKRIANARNKAHDGV